MPRIDLDRLWLQARSPSAWPVALRRAFLLALPLSVPLTLLAMLALAAALVGRDLVRPLSTFWNAPPRRISGNGTYSYRDYERRRKRSENVVTLREDDAKRQPDVKEAA